MFQTPTDQVLDDLSRRVDQLGHRTCPDVKARLRADVADTVRKRGPVHQDAQCQITECVAFPLTQIGIQYDSRPDAFSPHRWEWIADKFAGYFDCSPEDVDCDDDNLISVKGEIVGFVRTRIG
jgi:hypothetical protein